MKDKKDKTAHWATINANFRFKGNEDYSKEDLEEMVLDRLANLSFSECTDCNSESYNETVANNLEFIQLDDCSAKVTKSWDFTESDAMRLEEVKSDAKRYAKEIAFNS
jgi:hypothetical protein